MKAPKTATQKAARVKRHVRPIYLRVERACLIDEKTGEMSKPMGVLVPSTRWDNDTMRRRKLSVGTEVRAELKKPRNSKFDRLAHALGRIAADQIEKDQNGNKFPDDAHDALKVLQREAGVCCETLEIDLGQLGKHPVKVAQSLAHDTMSPEAFEQFFSGICRHLAEKYWPTLSEEQIAEQAELMQGASNGA